MRQAKKRRTNVSWGDSSESAGRADRQGSAVQLIGGAYVRTEENRLAVASPGGSSPYRFRVPPDLTR